MKSSVNRRAILESDLVLTSMGIETKIERRLFEWRLLTLEALATHARVQLDIYYQENRKQHRPYAVLPTIGVGYRGALGYLLVIWSIFVIDQLFSLGNTGVLSATGVQHGAWWLAITALTLHAGIGHIVANSVTGALFGYATGRYLGDGLAWFLITVSGTIANLINASFRSDSFYAIGASTACFAAAGILCGFTWRRNFIKGAGARLNYLPIAGAIGLFVFMGTSGENTDIGGHLLGLLVGLIIGAFVARYDVRRLGKSGQRLCVAAAMGLVGFAWFTAI